MVRRVEAFNTVRAQDQQRAGALHKPHSGGQNLEGPMEGGRESTVPSLPVELDPKRESSQNPALSLPDTSPKAKGRQLGAHLTGTCSKPLHKQHHIRRHSVRDPQTILKSPVPTEPAQQKEQKKGHAT
ncbi:hypothetical protein CRENBAI_013454 [Crenichthys baileyi]|uniref:Uncharacterized protein n=1 Tax=Crenichthys baileyi TaxID=28760 RepID=A0AAV9SIM0_9TELE